MKKILMVESCENESNAGDSEDTPDVQHSIGGGGGGGAGGGGDSSRSNSINSEHSLHSVGISATSSQVSLTRFFLQQLFNNFFATFHRAPPAIQCSPHLAKFSSNNNCNIINNS